MLREIIADVQHRIWSSWMKYLFSVSRLDSFGRVVINANNANRWKRQMNTDYGDLTERERDSDREQADKVLDAVRDLKTNDKVDFSQE